MQSFTLGKRLLIACAALLAWSGACVAQPPHGPMGEDFLGRDLFMFERMAAELELSDAQRQAVEQLATQAREAARPLVRQMIEQHRALRALEQADTFDEAAVRAQAAQGSAVMVELAVLHARNRHALRALLTPAQRERFDEMRPRRRGR